MPEFIVNLLPQSEKLAENPPFQLKYPMLYHQQRTYEALKRRDLVINTYNTGTGKTLASLLRLFDLSGENVLFIAPTNELIHQHVEDISQFVSENNLGFCVLEVNSAKLREMRDSNDPDIPIRNPKKLHELIENPRKYFPGARPDQPIILVTNPDIFYLCTYFAYSLVDSRNLFRDFLTKFDYIVVDEFHYYNAKQMANFLFFFITSREYGYFDGTRRVCLLSATPDEQFMEYLDRVGLSWELISPQNESADSEDLQTVPTLAPVILKLSTRGMEESVLIEANFIGEQIERGMDMAILSGYLYKVNRMYVGLRKAGISEDRMRRITGAVPIEERRSAVKYPLIIATPTVDIGYNFKKGNKPRQNIDILYFEALDGAELVQRLGRAGRVLGKPQTDIPSRAFGFVGSKLLTELQRRGQEEFDRAEFSALVKSVMGVNNAFYAYISSWGILEAFRPIYELYRTTHRDYRWMVDNLYAKVKEVFAPESDITPERLRWKIRWFDTCERLNLIIEEEGGDSDYSRMLWRRAAWRYIRYRAWEDDKLDELEELSDEKRKDLINKVARFQRKRLIPFVKREYIVLKALFHFRDSFDGPRCNIYDPDHLFQSEGNYTVYDLLHVLNWYEFELMNKGEFKEATGRWGEYDAICLKVTGFRERRGRVRYRWDKSELSREQFDRLYVGRPVCIRNIEIELFYRKSGMEHVIPLDGRIRDKIKWEYIPALILKFDNRWALMEYLETAHLQAHELLVTFQDGEAEYLILLGTQAYLVHAELRSRWRQHAKTLEPKPEVDTDSSGDSLEVEDAEE